jgi:cytochrome c oxidase assembly protein subunit 15
MVKSGLVDDPRVSSVRLAMHLGLALLIYGAMFWVALGLMHERGPAHGRLRAGARALAALVFVMVLSGALVAAIKAGYAYNTFPLMDGHWVPPEILMIDPWWMNFVNNMATVQLVHRTIAMLIAVCVALMWWRVRASAPAAGRARAWANALALFAAIQICVGIATLLLRVPLPLAAIHQAGAVFVFTCAVGLAHALGAPRELQP